MDNELLHNVMWWVGVFELPALAGLFGLIWSMAREMSALGLDVARTYAPALQVMELERRLTSHLLRIEAKLEATALKAEGLSARQNQKGD